MTAAGQPAGRGMHAVAKALLVLSLYFAVGIGASLVLLSGVEPESMAAVELASLAMALGLIAVIVFARFDPPPGAFSRRRVLGRACLWYALLLAAWVPFVFVVYPWLLSQLGAELEPQDALDYFAHAPATAWGPYVVTAVACLLAPIGEELVFRGYLQGALKMLVPTWLAVVLTAAVFGVIHGVMYALPVGLLGLFFGAIREKYGSLAVAMVLHALHNSLTVAVTAVFPQTLDYGS